MTNRLKSSNGAYIDESIFNIISSYPELQSLLHDLNLLPEQLKPDTDKWNYMKLIVMGFLFGVEVEAKNKHK